MAIAGSALPQARVQRLPRGVSRPVFAKTEDKAHVEKPCRRAPGRAPVLEGSTAQAGQEGRSKEVSFVLADERYIRDSILLPQTQVVAGYDPVMPSYEGQIGEPDLLQIIAYIKSLGRSKGGGR
ncbi:MAG: hypothetical protein WKF75_13130 [Singulisphaera sp.]